MKQATILSIIIMLLSISDARGGTFTTVGKISANDLVVMTSALRDQVQEKITSEGASVESYPNPFRESTVFGFSLLKASTAVITVTDALGGVISRTTNELSSGPHHIEVHLGSRPSGMYFFHLDASGLSLSKKLFLVSR